MIGHGDARSCFRPFGRPGVRFATPRIARSG
jgi:hypothetical protein